MTIKIVNPFAGYTVAWTWADHIEHGYKGGTDYVYPADTPVSAAADGRVTWVVDGLNSLRLTLADGRSIVYRELKAGSLVPHGSVVRLGDSIGLSGRRAPVLVKAKVRFIIKYPHIEGLVNGIRVPFEGMVTASQPSGGGVTPIPPTDLEEDDMTQARQVHYAKNGVTNRAYFVPGTAYWMRWTDAAKSPIANGFATYHETSNSVEVTESVFNALEAAASRLLPAKVG